MKSNRPLIALLVAGCLIQLGVIAHRFSAAVVEPPAPAPPPVPVVAPRSVPARAVVENSALPAWPAEADAPSEPAPAAETSSSPNLAQANLPPDLLPPADLASQLRRAREAGADLWLLAHASDTQFQRQLAAWQRRATSQERRDWEPNQMRREFIQAALGADAWQRLQIAEWARHRSELYRHPELNPSQAEALFELDQRRLAQVRDLHQQMSARQIDGNTFRERFRALHEQYNQQRAELLGEPVPATPAGRVPVTVVR